MVPKIFSIIFYKTFFNKRTVQKNKEVPVPEFLQYLFNNLIHTAAIIAKSSYKERLK